ncbi:hypothetical protein GE253_20540 [Niveispirillum sp. SYP-B3756]|uniref:hypothetical protein n=1 Tax=Niveispirillum sp. SYP-B3756 TaxID=2662178 RepID=UPI001291D02D|nr:hypothetical protein [Niveispirillum sp. SYP-B3756]MQP67721.1 hypothetical protein [Niveispirillum sp. SYP-B3756]
MDGQEERLYTPPHKKKDRAERQRGLSLGRNRHQACQEGIQPRSTRISFFFLLLKGKPKIRLAFLFVHFLLALHKCVADA